MNTESAPLPLHAGLQANILIAGEYGPVSAMIASALGRFGITADRANSADHAISLCHTGAYDVLLAAAGMVLQDGRSLLLAAPPTVAVVAWHAAADADASGHATTAIHLHAPFSEPALRDALATALGPARTGRALVDHGAVAALWPSDAIPVLHRVITLFVGETELRCEAVAKACHPLDRAVLRHEGHTLKGAAANIGAARLEDAAAALEVAAPIASPGFVAGLADQVCAVARLTAIALADLVAQGRS